MNDKDPFKDPFKWFFNACLLVLFGVAALSVATDLLSRIWPWALGIGLLVGAVAAGIAVWQARRRPW